MNYDLLFEQGSILIHEVHKDGAADRDGRLKSGDCILSVNGIDLKEATQKQATKVSLIVFL